MEAVLKPARRLLDEVVALVREVAAREVMPRFLKVAHQRKSDGSLFTEADLAAQDALSKALPSLHPGTIVAEEMTPEEQLASWIGGVDSLWCIDPIDGTSNFVNGLPYFAVSVALMKQGRSVLGVVYDPIADEAFSAGRGEGAWLNGVRLPIKEQVPALEGAMAQIDFKRLPERLRRELVAAPPYYSQRNLGASTLEWCYVAAGRFDVYLHGGQKLWDYAAGSLILEEAGGLMCTLAQDDFWADALWSRSALAARDRRLFDAWKGWIRARQ